MASCALAGRRHKVRDMKGDDSTFVAFHLQGKSLFIVCKAYGRHVTHVYQ